MKRSKGIKKRDYSRRDIRKKTAFDHLLLRSIHKEGMTAREIQSELKVTGRTALKILNELMAEDKVFKSKSDKKYYVKSLFINDGWSIFAKFLKDLQRLPLRTIYSHGYAFHDELENEIFDFGNMIGAFITYVLVESLRPNENQQLKIGM